MHKIRNHPASGNTKYKVCTYVAKKAVFLPEEGIATSSSMPRRIVSRKEPTQHVEHADVSTQMCGYRVDNELDARKKLLIHNF